MRGFGSGTAVPFNGAGNILTIVTPPGKPSGIAGFTDPAQPDRPVVVCVPQVPCGAATHSGAGPGAAASP